MGRLRAGQAKRQPANKTHELEQKPKSQEVVKGPLQIIVSIADQQISVYDDGRLLARSSVSTGVPGHPTPVGVFSVIGKELWHRSNIYSAAPMPYMQRITWSGIALHAGVVPGHPASHGCIRLAKDFAIRLWHLTKRGTRVIIAANNVDPLQVASPRLFSGPKTASSSHDPSTDTLAEKDVITLASTPAHLVPNAQSQKGTNILPASGVAPQKTAAPISVFVSRKLSRLFVRQRFTPLFDVPIKIENPERPWEPTCLLYWNCRTTVPRFAGTLCRCRRYSLVLRRARTRAPMHRYKEYVEPSDQIPRPMTPAPP